MDEQMNNNGYQSQPNPMPNQNKDNYAVAILVLGIVSICCCASVVEALGVSVFLTPGNRENIKITTPFDLKIATALIGSCSI